MSVQVMSLVFEAGSLSPTQKSILLALADHANEDGRSIYPSVWRLTIKTGFGERAIRKGLAELREKKILIVVRPATQHFPTEYSININKLRELRNPELDKPRNRPAPDAPLKDPDLHDIPSRPAPDAPKSSVNHHFKELKEEGDPQPNIFKEYENEMGPLTPHIADQLEDLEKEHTAQWVIAAIHEASGMSKRSLGYCKAILKRWAAEGYGSEYKPAGKNGNGRSPAGGRDLLAGIKQFMAEEGIDEL
jgi:DnaD/phage-associated family protein